MVRLSETCIIRARPSASVVVVRLPSVFPSSSGQTSLFAGVPAAAGRSPGVTRTHHHQPVTARASLLRTLALEQVPGAGSSRRSTRRQADPSFAVTCAVVRPEKGAQPVATATDSSPVAEVASPRAGAAVVLMR